MVQRKCLIISCSLKYILLNRSNSSVNNNETENDINESNYNVAGTSINASSISEKKKISQKMKSRVNRTENVKECLVAIKAFTSEMKSERESYQNIQVQILEEYKNIKELQEDFIKYTTELWATANTQREEKNKILKEIVKNYCNK